MFYATDTSMQVQIRLAYLLLPVLFLLIKFKNAQKFNLDQEIVLIQLEMHVRIQCYEALVVHFG